MEFFHWNAWNTLSAVFKGILCSQLTSLFSGLIWDFSWFLYIFYFFLLPFLFYFNVTSLWNFILIFFLENAHRESRNCDAHAYLIFFIYFMLGAMGEFWYWMFLGCSRVIVSCCPSEWMSWLCNFDWDWGFYDGDVIFVRGLSFSRDWRFFNTLFWLSPGIVFKNPEPSKNYLKIYFY